MNLPHYISKTDLRKIPGNSGATKYKVALEFKMSISVKFINRDSGMQSIRRIDVSHYGNQFIQIKMAI